MKESIKKIILSICAISVSAVLVSASALATERRSQPGVPGSSSVSSSVSMSSSVGDEDGTSSAANNNDNGNSNTTSSTGGETSAVSNNVTSAAVPSSDNVVVNDTASNVASQAVTEVSNKKYLSKVGGFLWFLLSVIVNFIVSCWVGNRFYKLSKKSAQSSAEIRALRKDIEEKFASTLRDISEPAIEVVNSNEDYSRTDEGISMPNRQPKVEITDEEREILNKWDSRQSRQEEPESDDEYEEENEERQERSFKSYQPTRRSSGIVFSEDDEENDEEPVQQPVSRGKSSGIDIGKAKNKAKNILSNIFPFDE